MVAGMPSHEDRLAAQFLAALWHAPDAFRSLLQRPAALEEFLAWTSDPETESELWDTGDLAFTVGGYCLFHASMMVKAYGTEAVDGWQAIGAKSTGQPLAFRVTAAVDGVEQWDDALTRFGELAAEDGDVARSVQRAVFASITVSAGQVEQSADGASRVLAAGRYQWLAGLPAPEIFPPQYPVDAIDEVRSALASAPNVVSGFVDTVAEAARTGSVNADTTVGVLAGAFALNGSDDATVTFLLRWVYELCQETGDLIREDIANERSVFDALGVDARAAGMVILLARTHADPTVAWKQICRTRPGGDDPQMTVMVVVAVAAWLVASQAPPKVFLGLLARTRDSLLEGLVDATARTEP